MKNKEENKAKVEEVKTEEKQTVINATPPENKGEEPKKLTTKQEWWQVLKFVLFSASAGIIQIVSFTLLNEFIIKDTSMEYGWSYFIALILSVLWNFTFNRKFTFKSASNVPIAMLEVFAFYVVFTPCSILWGEALAKVGWNEYLVLAFTMIINFVLEFLYQRYVVFRKTINTNVKEKTSVKVKAEKAEVKENKEG